MSKHFGRVCVIGSGMAGLMAARVLSDHFDKVAVFERDPHPDAVSRPGAAQGYHVHALLIRGQRVLEGLFPGLVQEMVAKGAHLPKDGGRDLKAHMFGAWAVDAELGFAAIAMTRPFLEQCVRARVEANPAISIRYGTSVDDILVDPTTRRITGVRLRASEGGQSEDIAADLVIDASGRGALGMQVLKAHGFATPQEDIVGLDFGYASAFFEIPRGFRADWGSLLIGAAPPDTRGALLEPVEGGRWHVALAGRGEQRPTAEEAGFRAFAKMLPAPELDQLLSRAKLVGEVKPYRFPSSVHRRYDLLGAHPEGFLAIGDAICSFNPIYGQGMSVSAMEVEGLSALLAGRANLDGLWRDFYPVTSEAIKVPWSQALSIDLLYETTKYPRPKDFATQRRIMNWAQTLQVRDAPLRQKFMRTAHLVAGPEDAVSLIDLAAAQLRVWARGGRAGSPPVFAFEDDVSPK